MSRLGDDGGPGSGGVFGEQPWPGPARALIDVYCDSASSIELVGTLSEAIAAHELNILGLGPPLRLQVPPEAMVAVMDAVDYERIRILHWPFSATRPSSHTGNHAPRTED